MPRRPAKTFGREAWLKDFTSSWVNASPSLPRRYSISGLGGVGKTHLGREVIEIFEENRYPANYFIWLRASDEATVDEDLYRTALALQSDLLTFSSASRTEIAESRAFHHAAVSSDRLKSLLEIWLKSTGKDKLKVLLILDDLDGLSSQKRRELAHSIDAETVDVLYTTRDPLMSGAGLLWEATNFDIPPIEVGDVVALVNHFQGLVQNEIEAADADQLVEQLSSLPSVMINLAHFLS